MDILSSANHLSDDQFLGGARAPELLTLQANS